MTNVKNDRTPDIAADPAGVVDDCGSVPDGGGDPLLWEWQALAAIAWEGYLVCGAGHVSIEVDAGVQYRYLPGAPCDCHAGVVEGYDPETQIVVAVHHEGGTQVHCLGGWPEPPVAWAMAGAPVLGAGVH